MKRSPQAACVIVACAFAAGVTFAADIFVSSPISVSETWTADNEYILTEVVYVTNGATLTIEPGTVVRGEPESGASTNDPGALVITRGSKIHALGNKLQPIVFTNLDDDNVGDSDGTAPYDTAANAIGITETWGGIILLGRGYVANNSAAAPNAAREVQIEGLVATTEGLYGNCAASPLFPDDCDDDDSGVMKYVSLRYGGFNLSAANEINGVTLGGTGRETDLEYIEVYQTKDDCIEFFGGAANVKHLVCANLGDDGIDYDEGWRGKVQHALVMQGLPGAGDKSDKGGEHDGGNNPDESQPFALPTLYNVTYIGHGGNGAPGSPVKAYSGKATNTGLVFRDNAGGRYYNSLFADFGGTTLLLEGQTSEAGTSAQRSVTAYAVGPFHPGPASAFQWELQDNQFYCFGNTTTIPTAGADAVAAGADTNRPHTNPGTFTNASLDNDYVPCANPFPIRALSRSATGASTPDQILTLDPRAKSGQLGSDRTAPRDGFFETVAYQGAFLGTNWANGWSTMERLGYFPVCDGSNGVLPNEVSNLRADATDPRRSWTWDPAAAAGFTGVQKYDLLRSTVRSSFSSAECVESDDADTEAVDTDTPASNQVFYYAVRAVNDCGDGAIGYQYRSNQSPASPERTGATTCP
jgi:hypothetical protein